MSTFTTEKPLHVTSFFPGVDKAEQLGAEGNVDESQKILMEVEKVRAKKKEAEVGEENVLKREETWLTSES